MSQYLDKDGASRIAENFLSKQAEQDAILRNLQFDLKEAEHALVKTIQGPAPLNIRALTRPLSDYLISGNTLQNGTPAPYNPVDVQGCGVRTENLFDNSTITIGKYIDSSGNEATSTGTGEQALNHSDYIEINAETVYTFKCTKAIEQTSNSNAFCWFDSSKQLISRDVFNIDVDVAYTIITATAPTGAAYLIMNYRGLHGDTAMLNSGSTSKSYEPYGYKLPLTVNGTEYPIYLGQVPTVRQIKKLVLTGEESGWQLEGINSFGIANFALPDAVDSLISPRNYWICSHFKAQDTLIAQTKTEGVLLNLEGHVFFRIFSETVSTVYAFKSYLAAQYAAGTPVTVWYVLAEPETAIVNEPIHKIRDYADTISFAQAGIEISTTKGFNTITTDTTVLPSIIEVKGVINNA